MKQIELKYRKWLRTLFGCVSFTAVAFVFQACYGSRDDCFYDVRFTGTVKSKTTNLPIKGIKVFIDIYGEGYGYGARHNYGITGEDGTFDFYADVPDADCYDKRIDASLDPGSIRVDFLDIDGLENGWFADKTIIIDPAHKHEVRIHVELDEKQ